MKNKKTVRADKLQPGQHIGGEPFGHGPFEEILSVKSDGLEVLITTKGRRRQVSAACQVQVS